MKPLHRPAGGRASVSFLFFSEKQVAEVRNTCTLLPLVFARNVSWSCCDFFF